MSMKGFIPTNLLLPLQINLTCYQPLDCFLLTCVLSASFNFFRVVFAIVTVTVVLLLQLFFLC